MLGAEHKHGVNGTVGDPGDLDRGNWNEQKLDYQQEVRAID